MKFIVMAGGQGTKLWPLSRDKCPKQFAKVIGEKTLFQINIENLLTKYSPDDIFVSTSEMYVEYIKEQAPAIPEKNYIIEPHLKKMTGPACGYAMLKVSLRYPDEVVMFYVQPVVVRTPVEKYIEMVGGIEKLVKKHGKLVTGGKHALHPETGSDYLKLGEKVEDSDGLEVYSASGFVERPKTLDEAQELINKMDLSFHCNHLTWTPDKLLNAFREIRPDWYEILMGIKGILGTEDEDEKLREMYSRFEPGNIELLTKPLYDCGKAQIVMLPFEWTHITTWNDVYRYRNIRGESTKQGSVVEHECEGNLIIGNRGKLVAALGLKDMVVVDTDDVLFVCTKNDSGKLPILLKKIEEEGKKEVL